MLFYSDIYYPYNNVSYAPSLHIPRDEVHITPISLPYSSFKMINFSLYPTPTPLQFEFLENIQHFQIILVNLKVKLRLATLLCIAYYIIKVLCIKQH